jgi:acyl-CoA synthetase (AMP-forming)/AMP-acid ligase II
MGCTQEKIFRRKSMMNDALPPLSLPRQPATLVELLQMRTELHPDQLLYTFLVDGESEKADLTYSQLDQQARRVAAWLQEHQLEGERALLLFPPGLEFAAAYMGCLYAGVIAVPSYPPRLNRPSPRIQRIVADCHAAVVLTTGEIYASMEQRFDHTPDLQRLQWLDVASLPVGLESGWHAPSLSPDSLAFLQYTSGSTSQPKGVMVSHANLLKNMEMIRQGFRVHEGETEVVWLPNFHDMGLIGGILSPIYNRIYAVLMSPFHFLQRPHRWLRAISDYKAQISGGPNFAYDLSVERTTHEQRMELDFSHWKTAFSGAEPVRLVTLRRFAEAFKISNFNPDAYYPCYGLAEATLFVSGGDGPGPVNEYYFNREALAQEKVIAVAHGSVDSQAYVGCGHAHPGEEIAIVDPQTLIRCASDEIGEIWVAGEHIAKGYWDNPAETERTFNARIKDTGEGPFMRTGDLGFIYDGELFIAGRSKDLIIIRGSNHYPQDIELTVELCHPAMQTAGGAAFSVMVDDEEQLVVVQELERTHRNDNQDEIFRAIRRAVSENHDLQVYAIQLLKPFTVPKTSSGKIQRHACKRGFLEGTLEKLGEWRAPEQVRSGSR